MAQEEEFDFGSAPGTPRTPRSLEIYNEKKKNGFKRLFSLTPKSPKSDKSASESGRHENVLQKDGGGGSESRRRGITSIFKPRGKGKTKDDGSGSVTPSKDVQTQGFMKEDKKEKTKTGKQEKTRNLVENPKELNGKERNEASREPSKPSELNPPAAAEATVEEPKLPEKHPHKHTQDDKGKSKVYEELESATYAVQENSHGLPSKEVNEHDHHQQHHHIQTGEPKGDTKEQEFVTNVEVLQETSVDLVSPPPAPAPLQAKEAVGCESIAEGFQKICLPWTIKKEEGH